jgi:hypothetical protein
MNKDNIYSSSPANEVVKPRRKRLKWIKIFVPLLILLFCIIYPMLKMRWAHNQVESFCMEVAIGMPIHGLEEKAKERGLKVFKFEANGSRPAIMTVWEGWAFARWFCEIEHTNGKVVSKKNVFLD